MMTEMGNGQVRIGDKSSVYAGAKVSLCAPFKRADVSRLAAKWSNSTDLTTIQALLTMYFYATNSAVHNFHRLFQCRALHMSRARFPCSSPSVLVMRERSYVLSMSPTLYLTSSLADNVPRPFYIQPNWTFQGTRWRQPTDFWSNWWFCSRTRWVSALGDCGMTIVDKS